MIVLTTMFHPQARGALCVLSATSDAAAAKTPGRGRLTGSMSNHDPRSVPKSRGVRKLRRSDDDYPRLLAEINDPPDLLYVLGAVPAEPGIAVVGSRECTQRGRQTAYRLGADLVRAGFTVVSGLARGIDSAAHRGALDGGGKTVAVLPCGIDRVYPPGNRDLARRIARSGAVVTELAPGVGVARWSFAERNRLIAGLALQTVVVEATKRSGGGITAHYALDYNRDLLAVPGPLGVPTSVGTNSLIAEGAAGLCTGIESVLRHLRPELEARARKRFEAGVGADAACVDELGEEARAVLAAIPEHGTCGVERIATATALDVGRLLAILTEIEVRGLIRAVGNLRYERV